MHVAIDDQATLDGPIEEVAKIEAAEAEGLLRDLEIPVQYTFSFPFVCCIYLVCFGLLVGSLFLLLPRTEQALKFYLLTFIIKCVISSIVEVRIIIYEGSMAIKILTQVTMYNRKIITLFNFFVFVNVLLCLQLLSRICEEFLPLFDLFCLVRID